MKNIVSLKNITMVEMDDPEYFATPGVSNSKLGLLKESLESYLTGFSQSYSPAFALGSAVHQRILEESKFSLAEIDRPSGKIGVVIEIAAKKIKKGIDKREAIRQACIEGDYYASSVTENRINSVLEKGSEYLEYCLNPTAGHCLTAAQKDLLNACIRATETNPEIKGMLYTDGLFESVDMYYEQVIFADCIVKHLQDDGTVIDVTIPVKMKADAIRIDHDNKTVTLIDLKTTGSCVADFGGKDVETEDEEGNPITIRVDGSFQKFSYYRQMAMYLYMLKRYLVDSGKVDETWKFKTSMVLYGTGRDSTNKHVAANSVYNVANSWIHKGFYEFIELMDDLAYYETNGYDEERNKCNC